MVCIEDEQITCRTVRRRCGPSSAVGYTRHGEHQLPIEEGTVDGGDSGKQKESLDKSQCFITGAAHVKRVETDAFTSRLVLARMKEDEKTREDVKNRGRPGEVDVWREISALLGSLAHWADAMREY